MRRHAAFPRAFVVHVCAYWPTDWLMRADERHPSFCPAPQNVFSLFFYFCINPMFTTLKWLMQFEEHSCLVGWRGASTSRVLGDIDGSMASGRRPTPSRKTVEGLGASLLGHRLSLSFQDTYLPHFASFRWKNNISTV